MCLNSGFFNSKDGAIDRMSTLVRSQIEISSFNSKDGAIDSSQVCLMASFNLIVSIPKMVRLIDNLDYDKIETLKCFNSKDGAIDSACRARHNGLCPAFQFQRWCD